MFWLSGSCANTGNSTNDRPRQEISLFRRCPHRPAQSVRSAVPPDRNVRRCLRGVGAVRAAGLHPRKRGVVVPPDLCCGRNLSRSGQARQIRHPRPGGARQGDDIWIQAPNPEIARRPDRGGGDRLRRAFGQEDRSISVAGSARHRAQHGAGEPDADRSDHPLRAARLGPGRRLFQRPGDDGKRGVGQQDLTRATAAGRPAAPGGAAEDPLQLGFLHRARRL